MLFFTITVEDVVEDVALWHIKIPKTSLFLLILSHVSWINASYIVNSENFQNSEKVDFDSFAIVLIAFTEEMFPEVLSTLFWKVLLLSLILTVEITVDYCPNSVG